MLDSTSLRATKNLPAIAALLLIAVTLALAGGASRAELPGQPIVRGVAILAMIVVLVTRQPLAWGRVRPILIVLGLAALICALQLVPLPPSLWYALGGRADFATLSAGLGFAEIWRPLSLTPDATINALFSLIVPCGVAIVVAALNVEQVRALLPGLIAFVAVSAAIGLVQLGSSSWSNPLLNETLGEAAGVFANRNHQALLLAIGLLLLPPWAMRFDWRTHWMRTVIAIALVPFFVLMILATGSRAGLVLAAVALLLNLWISFDMVARFARRSKALLALVVVGGPTALAGLILVASRTRTIDRLFTSDALEDFRFHAFPTVKALIGDYFPWGAGLGAFDTVFRAAEPLELLKPTYFNHAHNDFAEVALEAGLPGVALIIGAVVWVVSRAAAAQSARDHRWRRQARTGVGIIVLILIASAVDYPARVPIYMAMLVVAAALLHRSFDTPAPR